MPLPQLTGTVTGFAVGDTLASATTGKLEFSPGTSGSNTAGSFASVGSGLAANSGDYVFVQAPGNATALVVLPSGETRAPGAPQNAYSGALATTTRMDDSCAQLAQIGEAAVQCEPKEGNSASQTAKSRLAWRRAMRMQLPEAVTGLPQLPIAIVGSGLRLPADATAILSH
jgi:MBG domain (YGX type)